MASEVIDMRCAPRVNSLAVGPYGRSPEIWHFSYKMFRRFVSRCFIRLFVCVEDIPEGMIRLESPKPAEATWCFIAQHAMTTQQYG